MEEHSATGPNPTGRLSRLLSWIRDDPWDIPAWGDQSRLFRARYFPVVIGSALVGCYAFVQLYSWHVLQLSLGSAFVFALIAATTAIRVFRASGEFQWPPHDVIFIALIAANRPAEAAIAPVIFTLVSHFKKPVPRYVLYMNMAVIASSYGLATVAFEAVVGTAHVGSARWLVSSAIAWFLTIALCDGLICNERLMGLSDRSIRDEMAWISRHLAISSALLPSSLMLGAFIAVGPAWHLSFLLGPIVVLYAIYDRTDKMVDAIEESERDPLTGLFNRRTLELIVTREIALQENAVDDPSWIVLCDLDNFKNLNDTMGHDKGDEALVRAARQIEASTRTNDHCSRFGGEEFVIVVRSVSRESITDIAERLRASIEANLAEFDTTVSIGVHRLASDASPLMALNAADQAMYQSKRTGKNRVTFSDQINTDVNGLRDAA